jgi:hypothetical protein
MKLATLKQGGRDGTLIIVSHDLKHAAHASPIATTLQQAARQLERGNGIKTMAIGTTTAASIR